MRDCRGKATQEKPAPTATERQKMLMPAHGVGAAHLGKAFMQVTTLEILLHDSIHHRLKKPMLSLTMPITASLQPFVVIVEQLSQWRIAGLSGVIDRRMG
jgi:hypothetical protein